MPANASTTDVIAGVLLAAGRSRRVGQLKQALDWSGRTILRHVTETLVEAGLTPVCVVLGYERKRLARALNGLDVQIVENAHYAEGMFSSVRCGLGAVPADANGCAVALVDQPRITPQLVRTLVGAHRRHHPEVTMPRFGGRAGHPVVLGRAAIGAVLAASPMVTLRDVLADFVGSTHYVDVDTDSVVSDIDTLEDYERQRPKGTIAQPEPDD